MSGIHSGMRQLMTAQAIGAYHLFNCRNEIHLFAESVCIPSQTLSPSPPRYLCPLHRPASGPHVSGTAASCCWWWSDLPTAAVLMVILLLDPAN